MPTVSHLVQKYVRSLPHLEQFIGRDLVSFHRLARYLRPMIEGELEKEVDEGAIVMALSRLRNSMGERREHLQKTPAWEKIELSLRAGAVEIDLQKGPKTQEKVSKLPSMMEGAGDDIFSIVCGQYEITLITSAKYEEKFVRALSGEKILHIERNLSLLYLRFPQEALYLPGFIDRVLSELAWENINIFEVISTLTELVLAIRDEHAAKAYDVLRRQLNLKKAGAKPLSPGQTRTLFQK